MQYFSNMTLDWLKVSCSNCLFLTTKIVCQLKFLPAFRFACNLVPSDHTLYVYALFQRVEYWKMSYFCSYCRRKPIQRWKETFSDVTIHLCAPHGSTCAFLTQDRAPCTKIMYLEILDFRSRAVILIALKQVIMTSLFQGHYLYKYFLRVNFTIDP